MYAVVELKGESAAIVRIKEVRNRRAVCYTALSATSSQYAQYESQEVAP